MTKFKCVSHIERMLNKELQKSKSSRKITPDYVDVYSPVQEKINGRVMNVMKKKRVDPRDKVKGLTVDDFSIENLTAAGAVNNLKVCKIGNTSLNDVDNAISVISTIEE